MSAPDLDAQLATLGRGLVQANMKLSRIAECVERAERGPTGDSSGVLEAFFDLLEALENGLQRRSAPAGLLARWRRRDEDLWQGLELARRAALQRLAREGIEPIADAGPLDPLEHRVVEVRGGGPAGEIARTHRRGWVRVRSGERKVLRGADVTTYGEV